MNMRAWINQQIRNPKKIPLPVLSFPVIQLMNIGLNDFICNSGLQAEGMARIIQELDMPAALGPMDLSVEAEAFGSEIKFFEQEIPAVTSRIVEDESDAEALRIPPVGTGRTGTNLKAIARAKEMVQDRPVFAGTIGPFSLAGRLMGVSEAVVSVRKKPGMVRILLEKSTAFLIDYIREYQKAGADGVFVAEPLTGLLAPRLASQYSHIYMKQIIDATQREEFAVIYHNCGGSVAHMAEPIAQLGAMGYHFGNAIDLATVIPKIPADCLIMGNLDPAGVVKNGTPQDVYQGTMGLLQKNGRCPNYLFSTGCDISPMSGWDNIRSMFAAAKDFYEM